MFLPLRRAGSLGDFGPATPGHISRRSRHVKGTPAKLQSAMFICGADPTNLN